MTKHVFKKFSTLLLAPAMAIEDTPDCRLALYVTAGELALTAQILQGILEIQQSFRFEKRPDTVILSGRHAFEGELDGSRASLGVRVPVRLDEQASR